MKLTNTLLSLILLVCLFAAYHVWKACNAVYATVNSFQAIVIQGEDLIERANGLLERKPWRPFAEEGKKIEQTDESR